MGAVYDFSFAHAGLTPQMFVQQGALGVIGYVGGDPRKCITRAEVDAYHSAGLKVAVVHENTISWQTWDPGAANRACDALGMPADRPIYYASDENVDPSAYPAIAAKLAAMPGRPKGSYGESGLVEFCLDNNAAMVGWLTSATAWSPTPAPKAALRQLYGQSAIPGTDRNVTQKDDWGQWPLDGEGNKPMPLTMVYPPAVYEADYPIEKLRGTPHPHAGQTWLVEGNDATWVSSPKQVGVYQYLGIAPPVQVSGEWFDNLSLKPSSIGLETGIAHNYPAGGGGGGGGGASAADVANAVLAGLAAHPLMPKP